MPNAKVKTVSRLRAAATLFVWIGAACCGCGTTKMSDTGRTGTEQLLLSSAIDQAINNINCKPLAGKRVYLDTQYVGGIVDEKYVISTLRQHMLSQGCRLSEIRTDATYVVEVRAGAVGTNRSDLVFGVPSINLPVVASFSGIPAALPEIPLAKTTDQRGIAKIAVFAYNRQTGEPVWQSGVFPVATNAKDSWFFGMGPFQRGSIYDGARFAGNRFMFGRKPPPELAKPRIPVTAEAVFDERPVMATKPSDEVSSATEAPKEVVRAQALEPAPLEEAPKSVPKPMASEPAVPAGRIVRLPPLEQEARPDLQHALTASGSEKADRDMPGRLPSSTSDDPPPSSDAAGEKPFSLWRPDTWFRGSRSGSAAALPP